MAKYKVNEIFYSIQGEGRHAGRAAILSASRVVT